MRQRRAHDIGCSRSQRHSLPDFDLLGWRVNSQESGSPGEPVQAAGRPKVGRRALNYEQPWLGGLRAHSPLLATDVMLLDCVAKEGRTGTSDDPGIPGIHVKGVCES